MSKAVKIIITVLCAVILLGAGYVAYVLLNYYRVGDVPLTVEGNAVIDTVSTGKAYTITSYNVGFGAYEQEYTCVLDHCYEPENVEWKRITGKSLKAFSKENAKRNTDGAAEAIAALKPDFAFFQETDLDEVLFEVTFHHRINVQL